MPPPPTTDIMSAATPSTENPRPILKLNTASRQSSFSGEASTPSGEKKTIRIKVSTSQPGTPAVPVPVVTKTKAGRSSKPTARLIESRKRGYESDEDEPMSASRPQKKHIIKMRDPPSASASNKPKTPISLIKFKPKGEPVKHAPGDAYDSEASDREVDPVRETVMVLRTIPGPSTEYLRKAIEDGTIGASKPNGANFSVMFVDGKERRAVVSVNGVHFAAVLVDLPTITEAMKTWDRKSLMKNSDVTQMLLCFAELKNEADAKTIALPAMAQKAELKWPHGLTPPMHDAVNRRFRKGMSEKQLVSTTNQVKKLIADDAAAVETSFEYMQDEDDLVSESEDEDEDQDAEGEEDDGGYFGHQPHAGDDNNMDLAAALEAELNQEMDFEMESATPATQMEAPTPMTLEATTPAGPLFEASDDEKEEGNDEEEISDEDEDDDDELDAEELAKQAEEREIQEEIHDLQNRVKGLKNQLQSLSNPLIAARIQGNIQNINREIDLRKAKLNITDDE